MEISVWVLRFVGTVNGAVVSPGARAPGETSMLPKAPVSSLQITRIGPGASTVPALPTKAWNAPDAGQRPPQCTTGERKRSDSPAAQLLGRTLDRTYVSAPALSRSQPGPSPSRQSKSTPSP